MHQLLPNPLQVLCFPPHLHVALSQGDGGLDHLHDIDPLFGGTDGERGGGDDPRPRVVLGKVGEAQEVDGQEEDLVGGAEGKEDFLQIRHCQPAKRSRREVGQTLLE